MPVSPTLRAENRAFGQVRLKVKTAGGLAAALATSSESDGGAAYSPESLRDDPVNRTACWPLGLWFPRARPAGQPKPIVFV